MAPDGPEVGESRDRRLTRLGQRHEFWLITTRAHLKDGRARMRCERESVFVVLPAGSLFVTNDGENRAHYRYGHTPRCAEVVSLLDGEIVKLGRVQLLRGKLEEFARKELTHDDYVVIEATGNAAAVAEVLSPYVFNCVGCPT